MKILWEALSRDIYKNEIEKIDKYSLFFSYLCYLVLK